MHHNAQQSDNNNTYLILILIIIIYSTSFTPICMGCKTEFIGHMVQQCALQNKAQVMISGPDQDFQSPL